MGAFVMSDDLQNDFGARVLAGQCH